MGRTTSPLDEADPLPVLALARAQYSVICADLGTNFCSLSTEFLRQSRQVFLVTTPDLTAMHLAAAPMARLSEMGLRDRVTVLLNRKPHHRGMLSNEQVSEILGHPPLLSFHEDQKNTEHAILAGPPIATDSELGRGVLSLAKSLVPTQLGPPAASKSAHRFLEFLHLPLHAESNTRWQD